MGGDVTHSDYPERSETGLGGRDPLPGARVPSQDTFFSNGKDISPFTTP